MYPSPILIWTPKEQLALTYPEVHMMQKILSIFCQKATHSSHSNYSYGLLQCTNLLHATYHQMLPCSHV